MPWERRLSVILPLMRHRLLLILPLLCGVLRMAAQNDNTLRPEDRMVDMDNPTFVPTVKVGKALLDGDSVLYMEMNKVYVYPTAEFKNERQRKAYNRLVYNVKKVLPMAKEVNKIVLETYEYLQLLPDKKARTAHMKKVESEIYEKYKPRMKKLTYSQGKLLIKLVNRECNSSSYEIVQAFMGPIRAGFWQAFAWTFGASLKKGYDAEGTDRLTERVILLVESGQL